MVLKLYGFPLSACTRRAAVICREKKVPYELIKVDITAGEQKLPEFRAKQPFGQVPYIDDDGFILYESRAIGRYLEHKYKDQGTKLIPDGLQAQAKFEEAASIEVSNFEYHAYSIAWEKVFILRRGGQTNEAVIEHHLKALTVKLAAYEAILSKQQYLAGDDITLADLFHLPYGAMLISLGFNVLETTGPNLSRWWKDISSRPSWEDVKDGA